MDLLTSILPYASLLAFIVGFGFLVFVHELGHFLAAKAVGIRTTQFAVGFGQAIVSYRRGMGLRIGGTEKAYEKRARAAYAQTGQDPDQATARQLYAAVDQTGLGETEYRLNWIPLGGYVKMLGQEDLDPNARSDDPRAYNNKSIGARTIVISAGVVMNLIFGAIFFILAFTGGVDFPPNIVGGVVPGSPAATTYAQGHEGDADFLGLQPGDRVVSADGDVVRDLTGIKIAAALGNPGDAVDFTVLRPDYASDSPYADPQRLTYRLTPQRIGGLAAARGGNLMAIGVMPTRTTEVFIIERDSPAYQAGVRPGMHVVAIDGEPIDSLDEYTFRMQRSDGRPVAVTYRGTPIDANGQPDADAGEREVVVTHHATPSLVRADLEASPTLLGWSPVIRALALPDSPAARAGVKAMPEDDAITPGEPIDTMGELLAGVADQPWPATRRAIELIQQADGPVRLAVLRDGQRVELPAIDKQMNNMVGVSLVPAFDTPRVTQARPGSPAAGLNLPAGSTLLTIAGQDVADWADVQRALQRRADAIAAAPDDASLREVEVVAELALADAPTERGTITLDDDAVALLASARWDLPEGVTFQPRFEPIVADGPIEAVGLGFEYTVRFIQQTYLTLARLFQGSVSPTELRGPVGIVEVGSQATQEGWTKFLYFLALISVNLAVLNFLPIPITDGGHIVFLLIEKFTGKPPGEKLIQWATLAGLAVLGSVFLFVTYQDILRLVGLG
jgi:regulator of sigma E protease